MRFIFLFFTLLLSLKAETLHILAAANLSKALETIKQEYIKNHKNAHISISYLASGKAYAQIKNGAKVDIFISADTFYPQKLYEAKLASKPIIYAQGVLILFSKINKIDSPQALLEAKNIALPSPDLAPYGRAAKEVIQKLGLYEALKPSLRIATSISQVHQWVDTKNCDLGFGALSLIDPKNTFFIKLDPLLYSPINQALTITKEGEKKPLSQDFINFILASMDIFKSYGYLIPKQ